MYVSIIKKQKCLFVTKWQNDNDIFYSKNHLGMHHWFMTKRSPEKGYKVTNKS